MGGAGRQCQTDEFVLDQKRLLVVSGSVLRTAWVALLSLIAAVMLSACESEAQTATNVPASKPESTIAPAPTNALTPPPTVRMVPTETPTSLTTTEAGSEVWRGLVVAPEDRCSPYDSDAYPYSQSVERRIVENMGGIIYGPYTGMWFDSPSETDIEHIVARSEAHDSGLCAADATTKRQFASDLLNLTLSSPAVNRSQKSGKDAAEWLPDVNRCWFVSRVVEVRQQYSLSVDQRERDVLENILANCMTTAMVVLDSRPTEGTTLVPVSTDGEKGDALQLYDDDGNGRVNCEEARKHGIAPVRRGHPAYVYMDDRDKDGVVCE